jgi:hypothetical protein
MLAEAEVAAVTWRVQLAVLKDAKLDVTALSEPLERMMDEPLGRLSNGKLDILGEDEQPIELKKKQWATLLLGRAAGFGLLEFFLSATLLYIWSGPAGVRV